MNRPLIWQALGLSLSSTHERSLKHPLPLSFRESFHQIRTLRSGLEEQYAQFLRVGISKTAQTTEELPLAGYWANYTRQCWRGESASGQKAMECGHEGKQASEKTIELLTTFSSCAL